MAKRAINRKTDTFLLALSLLLAFSSIGFASATGKKKGAVQQAAKANVGPVPDSSLPPQTKKDSLPLPPFDFQGAINWLAAYQDTIYSDYQNIIAAGGPDPRESVSENDIAKLANYIGRRVGNLHVRVLYGEAGSKEIDALLPQAAAFIGLVERNGEKEVLAAFRGMPSRVTYLHELAHFVFQILPLLKANNFDWEKSVAAWSGLQPAQTEGFNKPLPIGDGFIIRSVQQAMMTSWRWRKLGLPGSFQPIDILHQTLYAFSATYHSDNPGEDNNKPADSPETNESGDRPVDKKEDVPEDNRRLPGWDETFEATEQQRKDKPTDEGEIRKVTKKSNDALKKAYQDFEWAQIFNATKYKDDTTAALSDSEYLLALENLGRQLSADAPQDQWEIIYMKTYGLLDEWENARSKYQQAKEGILEAFEIVPSEANTGAFPKDNPAKIMEIWASRLEWERQRAEAYKELLHMPNVTLPDTGSFDQLLSEMLLGARFKDLEEKIKNNAQAFDEMQYDLEDFVRKHKIRLENKVNNLGTDGPGSYQDYVKRQRQSLEELKKRLEPNFSPESNPYGRTSVPWPED